MTVVSRNAMSGILCVWGLLWMAGVDPLLTLGPAVIMEGIAIKSYFRSVRRR